MVSKPWDYDAAVIGGGPGGLVAALYLKRFLRSTVLINAGKPRAAWIPETHNLIGFDRGISGRRLLKRLHLQVQQCGVEKIIGEARVDRWNRGFAVSIGRQKLKVKKVILATGVQDIQPDIPHLNSLRRQGLLSYCPICDGYEFRDKVISVLAQDEHGFEETLFIAGYSPKMQVIIPQDVLITPQWRKKFLQRGIAIHQGILTGIEAKRGAWVCLKGQRPLFSDVVYVALGCRVNDGAFRHLKKLKRTKAGYLIATSEQRLSIPGLFGVGDCVNLLAQLSVAAGQGAVAATTLHNDLLEF